MQLTGKVAAVADPHGVRSRAEAQPDLQALEVVLDGLTPHGLVDMRRGCRTCTESGWPG